MRILIARFNHETNTFSPVPTPLASFHPRYGADAYRAAKGTRTAAGAFIDLAEAAGAEIVVPVIAGATRAGAWPPRHTRRCATLSSRRRPGAMR